MMGGGMMGGSGFGGFGTFGLIGGILNLVITVGVIIGIVVLVIWVIRRLGQSGGVVTGFSTSQGTVTPQDVVQLRYARGADRAPVQFFRREKIR
jgi:putative membrane protein